MAEATKNIRVIVVGGSGYAGFEVIRLLLRHPRAEIVGIYGPPNELGPMENFFPLLSKQTRLAQELFTPESLADLHADVAMLCVPHKIAMSYVPVLRAAGLRVIDWSADYRLSDAAIYEEWYVPHTDPDGLADAVYGLPEWFGEQIKTASLIANPGCYPTCSVLAIAPILKAGLIEPKGIVVNAVTGISGAGRTPSLPYHFPEMNENFRPYGMAGHRHNPEIEQTLNTIANTETKVLFQPHVAPMDRGMMCSIYTDPVSDVTRDELLDILTAAYADAPFVRVRTDTVPATKYVSTTNFFDVSAYVTKGKVVLFSALDNLIKGASGQAVQNMNIMFSLDETAGLY